MLGGGGGFVCLFQGPSSLALLSGALEWVGQCRQASVQPLHTWPLLGTSTQGRRALIIFNFVL